jgi:Tol biopolymer transport system component
MRSFISVCSVLFVLCVNGCRGHLVDPEPSPFTGGGNSLCYVAPSNGYWNIFTMDLTGTAPHNISNAPCSNEYPQWSPDGRYILFSRSGLIIAYDTKNHTEYNLTSDGGVASQTPRWLPNGKACFSYPYAGGPYQGTYIINPDGTDRKRILDSATTADMKMMFFYQDSYNFLYVVNYSRVYKTNIDGTVNEFLVDLQQAVSPNVAIQGFNPATEELLLTSSGAIETYSIKPKTTNIVASADNGYTFFQITCSLDCSKIAVIEHSEQDEYLSVLENGRKTRLVRLPTSFPSRTFSFNPMQFSPDGKYIAFSKQIWGTGAWVSFKDELYVVEIATHGELDIGEGHAPSWNPRPL